MRCKMKNKVWLITVIMITTVMSGCSNKESAKNLELKEISNPVEDGIAKQFRSMRTF